MNPRGRLGAALFVALAVVAGGVALEDVVGTAAPRPAAPAEAVRSDAWFCPHGGGEERRVWVVLANPAEVPASVAITTYGGDETAAERSTLDPGRQRFVPVESGSAATGTAVEAFGAEIGVGMVVARSGEAGTAAETCARRTGTTWFVPDGSTVRGHRAEIVVMNPTGADAVVDVALVKDDEVVEPGRFEGVVMSPGEVVSLDVGEVALGERTVTAIVRSSLGEVVAAGFGTSADGIRSVLGVSSTARRAILGGSVDAREGDVVVLAPAGDVPLVATAAGAEGQKPLLEDAAVEEGTAERFGVEGGDVTVVVDARGEGAFVAARRLPARTGAGGSERAAGPPPAPTSDDAATAGAPAGASAWIVPSPLTPDGGRSLLSLHNTGTEAARVAVTLLTADGPKRPQPLRGIEVAPGRTAIVGLTEAAAERPVTALVEASTGEVVAAQTGVSEQGFAVVTGVPWTSVSAR